MRKASFPSTVDIHSFAGYAMSVGAGNGYRIIDQSFSAKNAYGLELQYAARCWTKPNGEFEIQITEKKGR